MPAYLIADVHVTDPGLYDQYRAQVGPQLAPFGARFIVRGGEVLPLEGGWEPSRMVVIEFPDMATLKAWYHSPEYAPLITLRQQGAIGRLIAVQGAS